MGQLLESMSAVALDCYPSARQPRCWGRWVVWGIHGPCPCAKRLRDVGDSTDRELVAKIHRLDEAKGWS